VAKLRYLVMTQKCHSSIRVEVKSRCSAGSFSNTLLQAVAYELKRENNQERTPCNPFTDLTGFREHELGSAIYRGNLKLPSFVLGGAMSHINTT
jgi:hypothetical protein